jgi:hypothetical protein
MTALDVLSELRRVGGTLTITGDRLRCKAPPGALTVKLRIAMRERKSELIDLLSDHSSPPSPMSRVLVSRVTRLYPLLGRAVTTPLDPGRLWQVFSSRIGVVLDASPAQVVFFLDPDQIQPFASTNNTGQAGSGGAGFSSSVDRDLSALNEVSVCCANQLTLPLDQIACK